MSQRGNGALIGRSRAPTILAASGVWAMNEVQRATADGTWPSEYIPDPQFNSVTMLLHGNGTNGAQNNTILDSSANSFTVTRSGNTTQGTFSPYGNNWANYFGGSGGYLSAPYSVANTEWWTQDFTMEMWVYNITNAVSGTNALCLQLTHGVFNSADTYWSFGTNASGQVDFYYFNGSANRVTSTAIASLHTWNHIAMVYTHSSGTISLYLNGSRVATGTKAGVPQASSGSTINVGVAQNSYYTGYISNLRILDGTAVYNAATYTVPTAPLTAVANTSLLTCQGSRFRDASSNNFSITGSGAVSVQRFSPFAPGAIYQPSVDGGSGYFDGNGDYLSLATNTAFDFGTGDFTIEFWANFSALSTNRVLIDRYDSINSSSWQIYWRATGSSIAFYAGGAVVLQDPSATNIVANTWNHVAVTRSGSTARLFVNGALVNSATNSTSLTNAQPLTVGVQRETLTNYFAGYISNVRIIKGTALYTAAFTPSTTPLTTVTNTSLLLNFTNAGIIDNAEMNALETVGTSQISTAQSKFGGGSIYNPGTGNYPRVPWSPNLEFGSGSFTLEFWAYPIGNSSMLCWSADFHYGITWNYGGASGNRLGVWASSNGTTWDIWFADPGGNGISTGTVPANTWTHIAWVRNGSAWALYINGVSSWTGTSSATIVSRSTDTLRIGGDWPGSGPGGFNGYIDDFRITKGVARYTTNFTPPTAAFPDR